MAVRSYYGGRLRRRYGAEIAAIRYWERRFSIADQGDANTDPIPPTLIQFAQVPDWTSVGTSKATPSITWLTGDLIVVMGGTSDTQATLTSVVATGLTFTPGAVNTTSATCWGRTWSVVASSGGSSIVTANCDQSTWQFGIAVWVFRGSDGLGGSAIDSTTTKTLSLIRAANRSAVVEGLFDWDSGATTGVLWAPTSAGPTVEQMIVVGGAYTVYIADWGDQGDAATMTYGISGTASTGNHTKMALEIKGHASAGSNFTATVDDSMVAADLLGLDRTATVNEQMMASDLSIQDNSGWVYSPSGKLG